MVPTAANRSSFCSAGRELLLGNATLFGRSLEVSLSPVWAQVALGCLHDGNGLLIPEQWEADSLGGHWFR